MTPFQIGAVEVGGPSLCVIAGPCVIEDEETCLEVGRAMRDTCAELGFGYVFKASYDKANRTSIQSFRGPGLERGTEILGRVREALGTPALTDFHEAGQAARIAPAVDILQVPAFLARQTDLLVAAAETGRAVNVKKAQFMAPWDMGQVVGKLREAGCDRILLTERGVSFGYNTLVVDFRSLPQMRALGHPVCFDVTHSMQQPSGQGSQSGATREYAGHLARAAVAVGIDALFLEVHPEPARAKSDAAAQLNIEEARTLLRQIAKLRQVMGEMPNL
ncbi:MAG: 3-deoxy-8-phosphooctulonate synthase [Armatimonadota bacterium]